MGEEPDVRKILEGLIAEGKVDEEYSKEEDDMLYSISDKGLEYVEEKVKNSLKWQLNTFGIFYNMMTADAETDREKNKCLLEIGEIFRDNFEVNIFRVLMENRDKFEGGFTIKENPDEAFLRHFDPDGGENDA